LARLNRTWTDRWQNIHTDTNRQTYTDTDRLPDIHIKTQTQTDRQINIYRSADKALSAASVVAVANNTIHTVLRPFFQDYPGEPVPEEEIFFWTLWCKER